MILDERLPLNIAENLYPIPMCGCWIWVGKRFSRNGYGRVWYDKKEQQVHKVVYTLLVGQVEKGLLLDHTCRIRQCANPDHLEPVTNKVNVQRGEAPLFRRVEEYQ